MSSASPLWSRACPPASSMPVQGEAASLAGGEQGEGALLAGRSWHTSPGRRSRRRRGRRATATSLCPVTWGQCSTPTCRFSNVQCVHCKITQDKNILANWRVTLYSSSRSCNWVVLELIWTMLVKSKHYHSLCFVLMVWPEGCIVWNNCSFIGIGLHWCLSPPSTWRIYCTDQISQGRLLDLASDEKLPR